MCLGEPSDWVTCIGRAIVLTWVVTHRRYPSWTLDVPYVVLMMKLVDHDGVLMYGNFEGDRQLLRYRLPVRAVFGNRGDGVPPIIWRPDFQEYSE